MKRKILLITIMAMIFVCLFVVSVNAASTNEFGKVETSDTIDLTGMATDTDVRVVLYDGTEYHTYPSQYVVKNSTSIALDFSKINEAFGKSYETNSVIRLEVPRHVTNFTGIFAYDSNDNLVEIFFPWDANIKSFGWACFEGNAGLQKINFPKTVTSFSGNAFESCPSLKEVNFAEDSTLTSLASQQMFSNCKSLERIVIPHSVTSFGRNCFTGCTSLKEVVFSPNFTNVTGESMFSATAREKGNDKQLITIYVDDDFIADTTKTNKIISWDNNDMQQMVIMFTGTKSQAEAFVAKFSNDQHLKGLNIVEYDSTKTSYDYLGMEACTTERTVNVNRVLVYGYNYCDAFYKGNHNYKESDCVKSCERCGLVTKLDNPNHNLTTEIAYENGYLSAGNKNVKCTNESCGYEENTEVQPLIIFAGISTNNNDTGICVKYALNLDDIKEYREAGNTFKYGVVACAPQESGVEVLNPDLSNASDYSTVLAEISESYSAFDFVVRGFTDENYETALVMCAYVTDGEKVDYINATLIAGEKITVSQDTTANTITLKTVCEYYPPTEE